MRSLATRDRLRAGSVSQGYGSADPDTYQNVTGSVTLASSPYRYRLHDYLRNFYVQYGRTGIPYEQKLRQSESE
jgi:hypothetical protein